MNYSDLSSKLTQVIEQIPKNALYDFCCSYAQEHEELVRADVLPMDFDFEAHKQFVPMQPGDVPTTYADATALERDFGFTPKITLREGLRAFAQWYKSFYCK